MTLNVVPEFYVYALMYSQRVNKVVTGNVSMLLNSQDS